MPQADARFRETALPVTVRYDRRGVPHIFAGNGHELYFIQGFVTARDRLGQIALQAALVRDLPNTALVGALPASWVTMSASLLITRESGLKPEHNRT